MGNGGGSRGQTVKVDMPKGTRVFAHVDLTEDGDAVTDLRLRLVLAGGDAVQVRIPIEPHQGDAAHELVKAVAQMRDAVDPKNPPAPAGYEAEMKQAVASGRLR